MIQRLDVQNGSIARATEKLNQHETKFVALEAQGNLLAKIAKAALIVILIVAGWLAGHNLDWKAVAELFGGQ